MVLNAPVMWSFHYTSLSAMLKLLHRRTTWPLYKKYLCNQGSHYQKYEWSCTSQLRVLRPWIIIWKVKYSLHFFVYNSQLVTHMNQDLVEKHLCNQDSYYENTDNFHYACRGSHHMQPPNWLILMSAKMNGTQRKIVVSSWRMHCAKGTSWAEGTSNSGKSSS